MDCISVKVNESYLNGEALTSDNNLLVTVNITKSKPYTISATSSPDNKYFLQNLEVFFQQGFIQ